MYCRMDGAVMSMGQTDLGADVWQWNAIMKDVGWSIDPRTTMQTSRHV